jgi:hypothetical protein
MTDAAVFDKPMQTVTVAGQEITVTPVSIGKIPKVLRVAKPIIGSVQDKVDILSIIAEHGDAVLDLASELTGLDRKLLDDAPVDEFITLVEAVLRINSDFFMQKVMPAMGRITESLTSASG